MNTFFQKALYLVVTAYPDIGRSSRRIICLLSLSLVALSNCYAQSGWFWQNPLPQGNNIKDVTILNSGTSYAVGEAGTVIKSSNFGYNWSFIHCDSSRTFNSVCFVNEFTGWVASSLTDYAGITKLQKTTDGGFSWVTKKSDYSSFNYSIEFTSADSGYYVLKNGNVNGYIFKTINAGENWDLVYSISNYYISDTKFVNNLTGYACGSMGIIKTTNGGLNWENQFQFSGMGGFFNSIDFQNGNTGFAVGKRIAYPNSYQIVVRTTNSGSNWLAITTGTSNDLVKVRTAGENSVFVGGYNTLLKSTNTGNNWSSISVNGSITAMTFKSSNGLIVGNVGFCLISTNNGEQWLDNFNSYRGSAVGKIEFYNKTLGFALAGKNILKTYDGGINWLVIPTSSSQYLNGLSIIDSNTIVAGGGSSDPNSVIVKSTNGGLDWMTQDPHIGSFLNSIDFINSQTGFCCGSNTISKTTNGGSNWSATNLSGALKSICFVNENTGYVAGYVNGYKTTNSGSTWLPLPSSAVNLTTSIYFLNANTGFTTNYYMQLRKTTDGGLTWNIKTNNNIIQWYLNSVHFINELTGFAAGDFGTILKTTDGGEVWQNIKSVTNYQLTTVFMTDSNVCYIGGNGATILKSTNGGNISSLNPITEHDPYFFSLSQNYPNPFNPQTKIKFDVPANVKGQMSNVKLIIYDLLGREITTLVNEELKPGTYEADWDASNFSSGVYLYKIISSDFVETKKMVLMK